jgi:hypothetical protein
MTADGSSSRGLRAGSRVAAVVEQEEEKMGKVVRRCSVPSRGLMIWVIRAAAAAGATTATG